MPAPGRGKSKPSLLGTIVPVVVIGFLMVLTVGMVASIFTDSIASTPLDTFSPLSPDAREIDTLSQVVFGIAGIVFLLVEGAVLVIVLKFRDRGDEPDVLPYQDHGSFKLEIGWTAAPAIILALLTVPTVKTILSIADLDDGAMEITVTSQQWWWEFEYEGTDIVTASELVIPVGQPVTLNMTSRDVIHSFWVPRLAGKRDTVPGRVHTLNLEADEAGTFAGICQEFCGLSHANMRFHVTALDQADYDEWFANQQLPAVTPEEGTLAAEGRDLFNNFCTGCHVIRGEGMNQPGLVVPLVAGAAPNLTHLMSREWFAGAIFELYREDGVTPNSPDIEAWLRNPPAEKPMASDQQRGMPNLNLTEAQIDALAAYLITLK